MNDPLLTKLLNNRFINVKDYIIDNYVKLGLDEKEAMLLLHIYNLSNNGEQFLAINQLTKKTALKFVECSNLVFQLVQKNFIAFNMIIDENGKRKETFSLEPLYEKILDTLVNEQEKEQKQEVTDEISDLIFLIESEFGRTLSALEIEMINSWINEERYNLKLIKHALKEAVLSNAYSLKYVDRILLNWQKQNITSVEQAKEYTKTFKRYDLPKKAIEKNDEEETYVSWMK
ncbi:MAG TPA: DnaD domain protein [Haloplasmataceae bacterium]